MATVAEGTSLTWHDYACELETVLDAIRARVAGEWDNEWLVAYSDMTPDTMQDIEMILLCHTGRILPSHLEAARLIPHSCQHCRPAGAATS